MLTEIMRSSPQWVTALAVIENNFGSIVFENAQTACLRVGPFVMIEGPLHEAALQALGSTLEAGDVVTSSSENWYEALQGATSGQGKLERLYRQTYHWGNNLQTLARWLEQPLPPEVEIVRIDPSMAAALDTEEWSEGIFDSYGSQAAFLEQGLGFCLLHSKVRAAVCLSFDHSSAGAEIEVDTRPGYEGRGYATLVSAHFIRAALERGWMPLWDATNPASAAIAGKLGFVAGERYAVLEYAGS